MAPKPGLTIHHNDAEKLHRIRLNCLFINPLNVVGLFTAFHLVINIPDLLKIANKNVRDRMR